MEERTYEKWQEKRQKKRRQLWLRRLLVCGCGLLAAFVAGVLVGRGCAKTDQPPSELMKEARLTVEVTNAEGQKLELPDWVEEQYLRPNPYSRPGDPVKKVNAVVIHYIGNPGTTAQQNRDYFDSLADSGETSMSSNFIVGLDGEALACVPPGEVAYASNGRNSDTISIETCHPDESGRFNEATYQTLVRLTAWLCREYHLDPQNGGVIRHYDVTGKLCPLDFVEHPERWEQFLEDVEENM